MLPTADGRVAIFSGGLIIARIPLEVAFGLAQSQEVDDSDYGLASTSGEGYGSEVGMSLLGDGRGSSWPANGSGFPTSGKGRAV
jgi:hypothetical protein